MSGGAGLTQSVAIWDLQDRRSFGRTRKPWVVRWRVGRKTKSAAFATKAEAQAYESRLRVAKSDGERFDGELCLPVSWVQSTKPQVHVYARTWLAEQWPEWQPRTRASALDALSKWLPMLAEDTRRPVPNGMYQYLVRSLSPDFKIDSKSLHEAWLARNIVRLDGLTPQMIETAMTKAAVSPSGKRYAKNTLQRHRTTMRAVLNRALDMGLIQIDPWPRKQAGRSRRKAVRNPMGSAVSKERLPGPARMRQILDAMPSNQPASEMYRVMAYTMWLSGLRPSEMIDLEVRHCRLPKEGWGRLEVMQADVGEEAPGEPKTGRRMVPIPPELVEVLSAWISSNEMRKGFLFRTPAGQRPANLRRTLQRACVAVGFPPMHPYDLRHTAATTYLNAGCPPGEVAERMGHGVKTLLDMYAGVLEGDDVTANQRFEMALVSED